MSKMSDTGIDAQQASHMGTETPHQRSGTMSKLKRVIDAARAVSVEFGDALAALFAGKISTKTGNIWPDTSREITLSDGRRACGVGFVSGREGFDVVEVAPEFEDIVFTERKGHAVMGVGLLRYAPRVTVTYELIPFSDDDDVGGRGPQIKVLEISE